MTRTGKIILWSFIGVGAATGTYFLVKFLIKGGEEGEADKTADDIEEGVKEVTGKPDITEPAARDKIPSTGFPLKIGSRGKKVVMLQALSNFQKGTDITVDGKFGGEVRDALIKHYGEYKYDPIALTQNRFVSGVSVSSTEFVKWMPKKGTSQYNKFVKYLSRHKSVLNKYE